jgi:hypothetical protein
MSQIVQARCPHCQNVLRIPAPWLQQPMRCKYCQQVFQGRAKAAAVPVQLAAAPPPVGTLQAGAIMPGQPIASATSATSAAGAFDFSFTSTPAYPPRYRYQRRGRRWLPAVLGFVLVATAAVALIIFGPQVLEQLNPKSDNEQAKAGASPSKDSGVPPGDEPTIKKKKDLEINPQPPDKEVKPDPGKNPVNDKPNPDPMVKDPKPPDNPKDPTPPDNPKDPPVEVKTPGPKKTVFDQKLFPRRALAISVNDYLLANPLTYGEKRDTTHPGSSAKEVLKAFGNFFQKFPNTQLFELSDAAGSEVPLKPVIEHAIGKFLETSRAQDRIVVFFAGHIAKDDKDAAYLVPIEGDLDDPKTLIPVSWVLDQMKKSPARQKVLILNVARLNPGRGNERPGGDPLDEAIEKIFLQPPNGVQVWLSCSKDQQSIEYEKGSLFQEALCFSMWEKITSIPGPEDSLPLNDLLKKVNKYLDDRLVGDKKQVSVLYGKEPASGADFDPEQAPAATFSMKPKPPSGGYAGKADIMSILKEIQAIPPARAGKKGFKEQLRFETLPPFLAKVLDEYQVDGYAKEEDFMNKEKDFPIRAVVVRTKDAIRKVGNEFKMKEYFNGTTNKQVKDSVKKEQFDPGKADFFLKEALEELEAAKKSIKQEPSKRWRAHYYFTLAELKARLIYVNEYNTALAQIRLDALELPKGATGFQLASTETIACKLNDVREWKKDLKKLWVKIIDDFPDTPWALLARREKDASLGLEWRAIKN